MLVVEGSIPNEKIKSEGYWAALGTDKKTGQPITTCEWIDRLAPKALARGRDRHLRDLRRHPRDGGQPDRLHGPGRLPRLGLEVEGRAADRQRARAARCSPTTSWRRCSTCSTRSAGLAPMIPLDEQLRPTWLFGKTVHEGCDRAGYYEQGDFAHEYGSPKCLVKIGCWGPVVNCNVPKRGWMAGIGGCPNVGGICIGCTMPGFPDKFMPFMDEPPGGDARRRRPSGSTAGSSARSAAFTNDTVNKEPKWRHRGAELTTGYHPTTYGHALAEGGDTMATVTIPERRTLRPRPGTSSRCPGTRSPGSSAAWASTPRSTSPTARSPSATAPRRSSAATASS